jgi:predicted nuclease of restriction endonuclease-like (RecB) superfamily
MDDKYPHFASSQGVHVDADYMAWINELKARFHQAKIKSAVKVNSEQLLFNWQLGRDLVVRRAEEHWGAGVVEQVSLDLTAAFPEAKGFSTTNLWNMKKWYEFYSSNTTSEKLHQLGTELQHTDNKTDIKLHQLGGEIQEIEADPNMGLAFPLAFSFVPWRHHVEIITKCKDIDEALFYIRQTINEGWSRSTLVNCLHAKLYQTQGKAITNFSDYLTPEQSKLAQEITKDTYDFGFIQLPKQYNEDELEDELEKNITRFLLELGTGFAFIGRQKEIIVAGKTRRIDMLFYHIHLRSYIVCELKAKPFEPEFAGKLNFYVNAVDELLKTNNDNPTIGLLICQDKNQTEVKWAFKGITTPMGVASYDNVRVNQIRDALPSEETLAEQIALFNKTRRNYNHRIIDSSNH